MSISSFVHYYLDENFLALNYLHEIYFVFFRMIVSGFRKVVGLKYRKFRAWFKMQVKVLFESRNNAN